jgi:hypothetical protein
MGRKLNMGMIIPSHTGRDLVFQFIFLPISCACGTFHPIFPPISKLPDGTSPFNIFYQYQLAAHPVKQTFLNIPLGIEYG